MKYLFTLIIPLAVVLNACQNSDVTQPIETNNKEEMKLTYLALGDSYTIGESVAEKERWPVILADTLKNREIAIEAPKIIATTGWTTDELQAAIEKENIQETFSMVSLLIGVNNQYRGYPFDKYEKEFVELLDQAIAFAGNDTSKVFVVSIPDYGVTPFAANSDSEKIARELDAYNEYAQSICEERNIPFFNITPISRNAKEDLELVATDNLHPSGKMYAQWVDLFADEVENLIHQIQ